MAGVGSELSAESWAEAAFDASNNPGPSSNPVAAAIQHALAEQAPARLRSLSFPRKWGVLCLVVLLRWQASVGVLHGRVTHGVAFARSFRGVS